MKNVIKVTLTLMLAGLISFAMASDGKDDKVINKMKEIIDNVAPDDWYTLAECADICLKKDINRVEVAKWIDQSLSIKETPYNLEIKGDYYRLNHLPEKAGEYYLKAIKMIMAKDPKGDISKLQNKIAKTINIKTGS